MKSSSILVFIFGLLGTLLCMVFIIVVLVVGGNIVGTTKSAFAAIDETLDESRDGIERIAKKVEAMKITSQDVNSAAKDWAEKKAIETINSRLNLQENCRKLTSGLDTVDQWLEVTEASVRFVDQGLKFGNALGLETDNKKIIELNLKITELREQFKKGIETTGAIAKEFSDEKTGETDLAAPMLKLIGRLTLTLGLVDEKLEQIDESILSLKTQCQEMERSAIGTIRLIEILLGSLSVWMGTGQVALCLAGWRGIKHSKLFPSDT